MIIYPAIDIIDGKCVRLVQGDYSKVTQYSDSPSDIAKGFVDAGATHIHVVDLDGAKEGHIVNGETIKKICEASGAFVELGGGIRNMQAIDEAISLGISRVILGTAAVNNLDFVKESVQKYGEKIAVGIDAKDGMAATHGWKTTSKISALELAQKVCDLGVKTIIYTDIATDGMLTGPNLSAMQEMAEHVNADIIASGGVSKQHDLIALVDTGVAGAIVGKAIYTGNVDVQQAIKAVKDKCLQRG